MQCLRVTYWQILFVGKDQEKSVTEFIFVQHALQLLASLNNTVAIVRVDDEDDTLGVLEVMSPQRSDLVLSADIPHGELDVLVLDSLDVETCIKASRSACFDFGWFQQGNRECPHTNGRNRGHDFTKLQLVQNGGLSGSIKSDHENAHLLLSPQPVEQLRERETHLCGVCRQRVSRV